MKFLNFINFFNKIFLTKALRYRLYPDYSFAVNKNQEDHLKLRSSLLRMIFIFKFFSIPLNTIILHIFCLINVFKLKTFFFKMLKKITKIKTYFVNDLYNSLSTKILISSSAFFSIFILILICFIFLIKTLNHQIFI